MSRHDFDPDCPHCRPAIVDPVSGEILPKTHPAVVAANAIWDSLPREEQEALWRIWVKNSRDRADLIIASKYTQALQDRLARLDEIPSPFGKVN